MVINGTILVIDDNKTFLDGIKDFLEKECKYRVFIATNGSEAFSILKEKKSEIDIIILDIIFDDDEYAGIKILEKIKKQKELSSIEVIMLTVKKRKTDQFYKSLEKGAFYYIEKSYNETELKVIIKNAMERKTIVNNFDKRMDEINCLLNILPPRLGNIKRNIDEISKELMKDIDTECSEYFKNKIEPYIADLEILSTDLFSTIEELNKKIK